MAITYVPSPTLVLSLQFFTSAAVVWGAGQVGAVQVDALELPKVRAFSLIAGCFMLQLLFNMKALQYVHVDTFICFAMVTDMIDALRIRFQSDERIYLGHHETCSKITSFAQDRFYDPFYMDDILHSEDAFLPRRFPR